MFPKLVSPIRPGEITATWTSVTWVYSGMGSSYNLDIDASVDVTNVFVSQLLTLQLYLSTGSVGWYDVWTDNVTTNGTVSVISSGIFSSTNAFLYTKARFILNLGGQYSEPSSEVNIPYP